MENSFIENIQLIMVRELNSLIEEVEQLDEQYLWKIAPGIINPAGVLVMHICGNLKFFIGAVLGNTNYVRNKEKEFEISYLPKQKVIQEIQETIEVIQNVLNVFPKNRIYEEMPITPPQHKGKSIEFFMIQLCCHLSRHKGQFNYVHRIVKHLNC